MNKELHDVITKYEIHPVSYQKKGSVYLIGDKKRKYVIKLKTNNYDIYRYLISRDFSYFPNYYNSALDNYELTEYIDDLSISSEQKLNDYIEIIALLHYKTSHKRGIDLDEIKDGYESITNRIIKLKEYYFELNNIIDKEMFLSPAEYLLIRNISLIYAILDNSLILLNELYEKIKNEKSIRVALLHNNISLDHVITNNKICLISWDKSYFNNPVYELELLYRKYYQSIEINDFLKTYERINKLTIDEKKYLIIRLAIPQKINLTNDTYLDTKIINNEINYLNKVYELLVSFREKNSQKA